MHKSLIAGMGLLAMAALSLHATAQGTQTIKGGDKGGTKYPGSANGGVWKSSPNKDDGKPSAGAPKPGYDIRKHKTF